MASCDCRAALVTGAPFGRTARAIRRRRPAWSLGESRAGGDQQRGNRETCRDETCRDRPAPWRGIVSSSCCVVIRMLSAFAELHAKDARGPFRTQVASDRCIGRRARFHHATRPHTCATVYMVNDTSGWRRWRGNPPARLSTRAPTAVPPDDGAGERLHGRRQIVDHRIARTPRRSQTADTPHRADPHGAPRDKDCGRD